MDAPSPTVTWLRLRTLAEGSFGVSAGRSGAVVIAAQERVIYVSVGPHFALLRRCRRRSNNEPVLVPPGLLALFLAAWRA